MSQWIWQAPAWPRFTWQEEALSAVLQRVAKKEALLLGKASATYDAAQQLNTLVANIVASSAIESESLNVFSLRSSLAQQMGLSTYDPQAVDARSEGLAKLTLETLNRPNDTLTLANLLRWHELLFPPETLNPFIRIRVGSLRGETPMQVVSGRLDNPKVHFQAPPRDTLEQQLALFLQWFNEPAEEVNGFIRAGIAHFWFITLHPFDDGNGRLARALTDRALTQQDSQSVRLYAMAEIILAERKAYYEVLESSQKSQREYQGKLDITPWLCWFLECIEKSLDKALGSMERTVAKAKFWQAHQETVLNAEQKKVLNRLLDGGERGFEHGISARQYQRVAKVSKATATRHLTDLLDKGCLRKLPGGGRSTRYHVLVLD